jgi:signal transduction histidine kinase
MQSGGATRPGPFWLEAATWPAGVRAGVIAALVAAYCATVLLVDPETAFALRPLNLVVVLLGGLFFGVRGGVALGMALAVLNLLLYAAIGIFDTTRALLASNVLSAVLGTVVGAAFGRIRDLSLALRHEARLRFDAEKSRADLTTHVVHDLKNPLVGIAGHAQILLESGHSEDERSESARFIRLGAQRMTRMLMNLLDATKAEEGRLVPRPQPFTLGDLIEEVEREIKHHLAYRGQTLEVSRQEDAHLEADLDLVRRILLNLVENASKYTPRGRRVLVAIGGDAQEVEVSVHDEGPGIPPGEEQRIFEKFTRLDRDQKNTEETSRGLGLHFCRVAAEAHGGRIWVEPNLPHGSVFRVRLPRRPPQPGQSAA